MLLRKWLAGGIKALAVAGYCCRYNRGILGIKVRVKTLGLCFDAAKLQVGHALRASKPLPAHPLLFPFKLT